VPDVVDQLLATEVALDKLGGRAISAPGRIARDGAEVAVRINPETDSSASEVLLATDVAEFALA